MGILDGFLEDPQQAGLLNAAAQMLQASGPSLMPRSFGQVMGAGVGGFQQGAAQAMAQQAARQNFDINNIKMRDAESDLKNQDMLREQRAKIQSAIMGLDAPGTAQQSSASAAPMGGSMMAGTGAPMPDWMPKTPAQAAPQAQAAPANPNEAVAARLIQEAQVYAKFGDSDGAMKRLEAAAKLQPKYANDFRVARGDDGKLHNYFVADNGTLKEAGVGVAPNMTEVDLNGSKIFVDKNNVKDGQTYQKTMSFADRQSAARLAFDKEQASGNQDDAMDPLAIRMTAQQYLAGDGGALQNFGRGAQGAKNLNAVRLEIAKQATAAGMSGADIAAKMAEFGGIKAGQRTAGTRSASIEIAASEVQQLAPLALDASSKVARSGFKPFGNAQIMFNSNVNDPAMRQFAMANTALVNAYGQAMARGGAATVSDKDHARELLSTAFDQPSYAAAVEQLQRETKAAQAAPKAVRKDLSAEVSGRHDAPAADNTPKIRKYNPATGKIE